MAGDEFQQILNLAVRPLPQKSGLVPARRRGAGA
jgi:hypothetical protein